MNNNIEIIDRCRKAAIEMRRNALKMALLSGSNGAHLGAGLSIIEIMAVLYHGVMNFRPNEPKWIGRDRFILSKGHGTLGYYTALESMKIFDEEQLLKFEQNGGLLPGQPSLNLEMGIEYSSGTLGLGLSFGVGMSIISQKMQNPFKVFVLLGDGECNEGSVWESAMSAAHFKLSNLTAIVDSNSLQSDGKTRDVLNLQLANMWQGFGWDVIKVDDGHDINLLFDSLTIPIIEDKPRVIIANTIKGKGVSFMENNNDWHHNRLSRELFDIAIEELSFKEKLV